MKPFAIFVELVFHEACKSRDMHKGKRLESLHLATDVGVEARDKAAEEKGRGRTNNPVGEGFEVVQVAPCCPFLCQFAEESSRILVQRVGKSGLNGLKEGRPSGELMVLHHPLKPCQGWPFHVEGCYGKPV